jgi:hypothetical protein
MATSAESRIPEWTKHPIMVLLLGTLVGSIVIPRLNERATREAQLRELRTNLAQEAVTKSAEIDSSLNALVTTFGTYVKDSLHRGKSGDRAELRRQVYTLYREFERDAWWWHWRVLAKAKVLRLATPEQLRRIDTACWRYQENLKRVASEVDRLWYPLITAKKQSAPLFDEIKKRFDDLALDRQQVIQELISPLTE